MDYLYLIAETAVSNADTAFIKIGVSDKPLERLKQLQTANPRKLELIGLRPIISQNREEYERSVHEELKSSRSTGEWFVSNPEVKNWKELNVLNSRPSDLIALTVEEYFMGLGEQRLNVLKRRGIERCDHSKLSLRSSQLDRDSILCSCGAVFTKLDPDWEKIDYRFSGLRQQGVTEISSESLTHNTAVQNVPVLKRRSRVPEEVKQFRERMFRLTNDHLEPAGFVPREGMGNGDKMRALANILFPTITNLNQLSPEQWGKFLNPLETKLQQEGAAAVVKYIEDVIGI